MLQGWLDHALQSHQDANAMTLSTLKGDGYISSRIVLLRGLEERGLSFFTNYQSEKGLDLEKNHIASVNFFWPYNERQVRVEGSVEKLSSEESDAYFAQRPRESQIGAWASLQSQVLEDREILHQRVRDFTSKFEGQEVPRPSHWGGYLLVPVRYEFWQGRANRLHDRFEYLRQGSVWEIRRLYP